MPGWDTFRHFVGLARCSDDKGMEGLKKCPQPWQLLQAWSLTPEPVALSVLLAALIANRLVVKEWCTSRLAREEKESAGTGHQSFGPTTVDPQD